MRIGTGGRGAGPAARAMSPVGLLVQEHRRAAGLTQRELADAAGMSVASLRDLEQGRTLAPREENLESLVRVLGLGNQGLAGGPGQPDVAIGVLGPLVVTCLGEPVQLGPARQRAVLGLLALQEGAWLHRDAIVDTLWGDQPPASAVPVVQRYISRLRTLLDPVWSDGGRDGLIVSSGCGYQLVPGVAQVDLTAFGQQVRRGDAALVAGDAAGACGHFERGLDLWRGDPVSDVDGLRGHPAATTLQELRSDVVLRYARAAAAAGTSSRALPQLRALCARERFHEPAHAQLMIALAASGQQGAALQTFAALAERLGRELGIRPSPALTQAHVQVLRQQCG